MFKRLFSFSIIFSLLFSFSFAEPVDVIGDSVGVVAQVLPPSATNTALDVENIIDKVEEVQGKIDQWQIIAAKIKSGSFSIWSLIVSILALLMSSIITIGVLFVMILRFIALFTSDEIDTKLLEIEDWVTYYIIKMPITIITKLRYLKKKT